MRYLVCTCSVFVCVGLCAASDCKPYTERVLAAVKEGQFAVLLKQML